MWLVITLPQFCRQQNALTSPLLTNLVSSYGMVAALRLSPLRHKRIEKIRREKHSPNVQFGPNYGTGNNRSLAASRAFRI